MRHSRIVGTFCACLLLLSTLSACGMLPSTAQSILPPTPSGAIDGPIHTEGSQLVDSNNHLVHLTGVNWFGFETSSFAPHGLDVRNSKDMFEQMAQAGFNTVRLPYTNQLFDPASTPQGINYQLNPDLKGLKGLALMDRIIQEAREVGLKIILDRHRPTAAGQSELWYTSEVPESKWISDWVMLAKHYRGNDTVIGADLHNEPHGSATWGSGDKATDWRLAAEKAGNAVLAANPDWLIFVEGIEGYEGDFDWWGGNLMGAEKYPVRLSQPDKLVYEAHDYGPEIWNQQWFQAANFPQNLPAFWEKHWAYLQTKDITPVLMGEFGGRSMGQDPEGEWQRTLVTFLKTNDISYTYWSWNPDSGDTGGLLEPDWKTLDQAKLDVLSAYQWPIPGSR